ncbi:MAG: hypothetical protein COW00_06735 [Bdellovibrio sp. CG12_big_fil_rev_8_21_14_0_65_39_13]|nr:MAG: hypothetical protein COW78_04230 [Bdellovibrio sp. CG22_combo_CG10-13_8_21_14_all_39_27]PIQ60448.1 MAG: hypothetical protein COW00_06735 [Bdellovibrio sp. CG12_big_fil_rev_8_21_14_0_65_39_13]PIR34971.1 MAG: hypothetical protein COV37_11035 [Bdellovibrio sp. CG11_big_fil_rev_8_21_14_0_20_39_38]
MQECLDLLASYRKELKSEILKKYPSVEKFCLANGYNKGTVGRILNGKRRTASLKTLHDLAAALDLKMEIVLKK